MRVFLRQWRELSGMTQEQIAEAIGTTKVTVSRMETGSREPNLGYLAAFAEVAGCRPADLFHKPGEVQSETGARKPALPGSYQDATEEELALALNLIRTVRSGNRRSQK
jgi:Predicted transcriptional regulators